MRRISWMRLIILYIDVILICPTLTQAYLVWVRAPRNRAVALGVDFILPCQAESVGKNSTSSILSYKWTFNGGNLTRKASLFFNHSLFISAVSLAEIGNYSCNVTSVQQADGGVRTGWVVETLVGTAIVIEAYINPFFSHPVSLEGTVGQNSVLTCITGRSAPSLQVQWLRNGEAFTGGETLIASYGDYDTTGLSVQLSMKLTLRISSRIIGLFECVAFNDVIQEEERSEQANVTNKFIASDNTPFIEWNLPESLIVAEGQNLILPCQVIETTEPVRVNWKIGYYIVDESQRVYVLPNNSLGFLPVGPKDSGNYSCVAENSQGFTVSPNVQLVVAFLGINFLTNPSDANVIYGQDVVLKCVPPESVPPATVMWYKDYKPIDSQSFHVKVIDNNLYLTFVMKSDNGLYYCVAFNNLTTPSSRTSQVSRLRVEGPPVMTQPPVNTIIVKGKLLHLVCHVDSDPTPNTTWQFEGRALPLSSRVSLMNQGQELWITNVGKEWEGVYTCLSRNKYGSASAEARVIVLVPPASLKPIGNVIAKSGDWVLIPCTVVCDPMPSIQWLFHNQKMSLNDSLASVGNLSWSYRYPDLIIEHVQPHYAGKYSCVGTNEAGNASSSGWLVVHVPPVIKQAPTDITAVIDAPVTLSCQSEGNPIPTIHWLYNSTTHLPKDVRYKDNNSTLMLPVLVWHNIGTYTCVAENTVGTAQATAAVKLMVPPRIEEIHFPQIPVRIHTRFSLSCIASGIPTPLVQWAHFDKPIQPSLNRRVHMPEMGLLVVEFAWKNDSGQYACWTSSIVGQHKKIVSVVVYGQPSPPVLLLAVPLSSQSVFLLWQWSDHGDVAEIIDKFQISFWDKTNEVASVYEVKPLRNETRTEVMGLQPALEYMFSISAVNDAGAGPPSNVMSAITLQSRPSPPVSLQVSAVKSTSVILTWEVPTSPNGVVRMYEIRYRRTNGTQQDYTYMNITDLQFPSNNISLSPLLPYSEYEAQVRACNIDRGLYMWGDYSSFTFHTLAAKPSLPPQNIQVDAIDQYSLRVTWQHIPIFAQNGPVLFYYVNFTNESQPLRSTKLIGSMTSYAFRGLSPWRYYSVTLAGENEAGMSSFSDPRGTMTLPIAPVVAPGNFQVSANSASSLRLSWKALQGDFVTCNITAYLVEYRTQVHSTWVIISTPSNYSSSSYSYVIESLLPWTWYESRVAAFSNTLKPGKGPPTDVFLVRTLQGVASPVTFLSYTINSTSVMLSWQPPKDIKGVLIGYRVAFEALGSINASNIVEINTTSTMTLLQGLSPNTVYNISLAAVNAAGNGQELVVRVTTSSIPPTTILPTTSDLIIATNTSNSTQHLLGQSNNSYITKNLASIVAGSIVGAIALIVVTVVVCIKCLKYRQRLRLNYDIGDTFGVDGTSYRSLEPSSDIATISSSNSFQVTDSQSSSAVTQSLNTNHSALDAVRTGENADTNNSRGAMNVREKVRSHSRHHPSLPILSQTSSYSVLQEDNRLSHGYTRDEMNGIDNLGFTEVKVETAEGAQIQRKEVNPRPQISGRFLSVTKDDTVSISSETFRRSRMQRESAAAIAVLRNNQVSFPDDTDVLMDFESIGSEVVFTERTVL